MNEAHGFLQGAVGVNDDDILIDADNMQAYGTFMFMHLTGAVDVFVSFDGTNYCTDPLSLADFGDVSNDPVIVSAANRVYGFRGVFKKIRIMQNGGTAVTGLVLAYGNI